MPTRKVLLPTQPSLKTGSGDAKRSSKTSIFLCFFDANTRYISYTADIVAERRSCCSRFFVKSSLPRLIPRTVVASTGQVNSLVTASRILSILCSGVSILSEGLVPVRGYVRRLNYPKCARLFVSWRRYSTRKAV